MTLAAIETSGSICGVAIFREGRLLYNVSLGGDRVHDRACARMVEEAFENTELKPTELDHVAVSVGPGSFTGLRIGISVGVGLAIGAGAKMIPVPTLDACAYASMSLAARCGHSRVLSLAPAGRDLVYAALFEAKPAFRRITEYRAIPISSLSTLIDETTAVVGPGAELIESGSAGVVLPGATTLSAESVGLLGLHLHYRGVGVGPEGIEPLYIREFTPKISAKSL